MRETIKGGIMSLTDGELKKIEAVINARADLQDGKSEKRFARIEATMVTKADLARLEDRLSTKIDRVADMHTEDHTELSKDIAPLRKLPARIKALEQSR